MRSISADKACLGLLVLLWFVAILLVGPGGDFAINDDFAYQQTVFRLLGEHRLKITDWAAPNFMTNLFWGAGFALLFGVNAVALRWSTLIAGLIGLIAFYRLARLAKAPPQIAALATAAVTFNPVYLSICFTFMTDILYVALQIVAMWLLSSGPMAGSAVRSAAGWGAGLLALLSRQTAAALPPAMLVEALARRRPEWRRAAVAIVALVVFVVVQKAYGYWIQHTGIASVAYGRNIGETQAALHAGLLKTIWHIVFITYHTLHYCGLFALPITTTYLVAMRGAWSRRVWTMLLVFGGVYVVADLLFAVKASLLFPAWDSPFSSHRLIGNALNTYAGIGDPTSGTPEPRWIAWLMSAVVAGAAALLLLALASAARLWLGRERDRFEIPLFGLATALVLFAPLPFLNSRFDRYFLPILPGLLLFLLELARHYAPSVRDRIAGALSAAVLALLSIGGTHDFMETQRTLWQAYGDLKRTVPAELIDAGTGFNGAASFGRYGDIYGYASWFKRADYVVSAAERPGYTVERRYPVRYWLPWNLGGGDVMIQRHTSVPTPAAP